MSRPRCTYIILAVALLAGLASHAPADETPSRCRYVFLFIGDGMGVGHVATAEMFLRVQRGKPRDTTPQLVMNSFPQMGLATICSTTSLSTDSAASGTALATGCKTRGGVVSRSADGKRDLPTIAERAKQLGMRAGVVTNVCIDHATPAVFYAHNDSRGNYYDISMALANSKIDYFGGGPSRGARDHFRKGRPDPIALAKANGLTLVTTKEGLEALTPDAGRVWACHVNPETKDTLKFEIDRPNTHPSLADFTRKGIEILENPKGFFMMVEGGKIDWAAHSQDAATCVRDVIAFDKAVAEAVAFYRKHPTETLIVVTSDHETGGMVLGGGAGRLALEKLAAQTMSTQHFADVLAPAWRENKTPFDEALPVIVKAFGLTDLQPSEKKELEATYALSMEGPEAWKKARLVKPLYGKGDPLAGACAHLVSRRAGVAWTTYGHTAMPVPVMAIGPAAERFAGLQDNAQIGRTLQELLGAAVTPSPGDRTALPGMAPTAR